MARTKNETGLLAVLLMGLFITNVDVAIVNVATPSIQERLNASGSELQFVVSGYVLAYAMLLITGARLGAMYGYRRLFLIGLVVFTVASLGCGLAPNATVLIVSRVIQGIGAGLMVPQVLTGIQLNFADAARTRAIGFYSVALSIGAVAGQVLGGVLVSANLFDTGWRPIFLINLPIGAVVIIAALRFLPVHNAGKPQPLDLWGVATLSSTVLLAVLPLILGHTQHWPVWTWISLAGSVIPLSAFIIVERRLSRRDGHPLINLHIVTQPAIAWALASYGTALMTYFSLLFTLALYLQEGLGKTALYSGLALVSWVAAYGIGGPVVPHIPARFTSFVASFGFLILAVSYFAISLSLFAGHSSGILLFVLLGFGGLGLGIGITANIRQMTAAVPSRYAPDMSGLITTAAQTSGAVGIATFGTVYFSFVSRPGSDIASHAFAVLTAGFAFTALLATIAAYRSSHASAETEAGVRPLVVGAVRLSTAGEN
jgi:predicted MFS family arabinose efflux permease